MDAERWKRVDDLLQSALQLLPDAREPFLRQACADAQDHSEVAAAMSRKERQGSPSRHRRRRHRDCRGA
jgi:hypothetical protein